MKKLIRNFLYLMLALALTQLTVACSEEAGGSGGGSSGGGGDSPIDDVPVETVENTGFWVNVRSDQFDVYIDKEGSFDSDCFIDADATSSESIKCFVDVLEGDLYMQEVTMQYNAPPNLCDHVVVSPAWHWNESPGYGPRQVRLEIDNTGDDPVLTNCQAWNENTSALVACAAHPELANVNDPSGPTCVYDRSDNEATNCCLGTYELTTVKDEGGGDFTTTVDDKLWGGDPKSCIQPALSGAWGLWSAGGYPINLIQAVPRDSKDETVGLNKSLSLPANAKGPTVNYSYWANFFETTGSPHNHTSYFNGLVSDAPYAVEPLDDLDSSLIASGNRAWQYSCLDSGFEEKHRISVYIREWNTLTDFVAYQTSSGVTYNPDVVGSEGTNCNYDPIFSGNSCNDLLDFGDILTTNGGSYNAPGDTASDRRAFFPNRRYSN